MTHFHLTDRASEGAVHPAAGFADPDAVVRAGHISADAKREILASWASDAQAVEASPALRRGPSGEPVRFEAIMAALRRLDRMAAFSPANDDAEPPRRPPAAQAPAWRDRAA